MNVNGKQLESKTWKREVASILLFVWCIVTLRLAMWPASIEFIGAFMGVYGIMTPAVIGFAMAAFGFDAWANYMRVGPPTPPPAVPQPAGAAAPAAAQATATSITGLKPSGVVVP